MIGQHKRPLELAGSLPPTKYYKHFDESNNKSNKWVTVQADGPKNLVKQLSAAPVQALHKPIHWDRPTSSASVSNPGNCARKSDASELRRFCEWDAILLRKTHPELEERGETLQVKREELLLREDEQGPVLPTQNSGAGNAHLNEGNDWSSAMTHELQLTRNNNDARPFTIERQGTMSEMECNGAVIDSAKNCLGLQMVDGFKPNGEKYQISVGNVSMRESEKEHQSVHGVTGAAVPESDCVYSKERELVTGVELRESDGQAESGITTCSFLLMKGNEDWQTRNRLSSNGICINEERVCMNSFSKINAKKTIEDHHSPANLSNSPFVQNCSGVVELDTVERLKENPACPRIEKEDSEQHTSQSERFQGIEVIQAGDISLRERTMTDSSDEPVIKDLNKRWDVQEAKLYQNAVHLYTQSDNLKEETKQKALFRCLTESPQCNQQSFEGTILEHVVKMGSQALWCVQASSHSHATEHSGPGSASQTANAYEELESEGPAIVGTPGRRVPIGSHFQAELPQLMSVNGGRDLESEKHEPDSYRWLGERVWPLWGQEAVVCEERISRGRPAMCSCAIRDAMECVRLHVGEEREALKSELREAFYAWGFDEMGENVTEHWTCEEELTFQELVRMNPVSHKKNFWHQLFVAFPSRSMRELVSYYFNVFMLRRRAIQNRVIPENIDSDDDEMELLDSEDDDSASLFETDEEADESQVADAASEDELDGLPSHVAEESGDEENMHGSASFDDSSCGIESTILPKEHGPAKPSSRPFCTLDSRKEEILPQCFNQTSDCSHDVSNRGDKIQSGRTWEILSWDQTNHCHSSQDEGQPELPYGPFSTSDRQALGDCSTSKEGFLVNSHHCVLDQCETKVWDVPSVISSQKDVDKLISTKGMMEEFFGEESWEGRD